MQDLWCIVSRTVLCALTNTTTRTSMRPMVRIPNDYESHVGIGGIGIYREIVDRLKIGFQIRIANTILKKIDQSCESELKVSRRNRIQDLSMRMLPKDMLLIKRSFRKRVRSLIYYLLFTIVDCVLLSKCFTNQAYTLSFIHNVG